MDRVAQGSPWHVLVPAVSINRFAGLPYPVRVVGGSPCISSPALALSMHPPASVHRVPTMVPTLWALARSALDMAYVLRGDDLLAESDAQLASLHNTGAVIPSPQEMWENELSPAENGL